MASAIAMPLKVIKLLDKPIKLARFEDTTWVALKSLTDFLNLDYDKQVANLAANTSIAAVGRQGSIEARAKVLVDPNGESDMWIPMDNVSLFASKIVLEDLSRHRQQLVCMADLPEIMARTF